MTTRAAIYLRQSQDRDGNELAVTRQRADCVALCEQKSWTATEYCDNYTSASNGKLRKDYQARLEKEGLTEGEAFDRLRRASQVSGRPLKVIAEAVVVTLGG